MSDITSTCIEILSKYEGIDPKMVRLTAAETAVLLDRTPRTLEAMRARGTGPLFMKTGRRVYYRLSDVLEFMEACVYSTSREAKRSASGSRISAPA